MSAAAKPGAARACLLDDAQVIVVDPAEIDTAGRIGFLHPDKAEALGRLMLVDGQRDAIKITPHPKKGGKPWLLVTGLHRTEGAAAVGIGVRALVVKGKPEELADLEASENLHRRPLAPLERAKFVQALCEAAQQRIAREHGQISQHKLAVKARWARVKTGEIRADQALQQESDDTVEKISTVYGWQESAADAFGLGKRSVRNALHLYRMIVEPFPELVAPLSRHPVVGENAKQLRDIADLRDERIRRQVIETLIADPELGAGDAIIQVMPHLQSERAPTPFEKFGGQIMTGWGRLGLPERRRFIETDLPGLFTTPDLIRRAQAALAARLEEMEAGDD